MEKVNVCTNNQGGYFVTELKNPKNICQKNNEQFINADCFPNLRKHSEILVIFRLRNVLKIIINSGVLYRYSSYIKCSIHFTTVNAVVIRFYGKT